MTDTDNNNGMPNYISPVGGEKALGVTRPAIIAYIVPFVFGGWFVLSGLYSLVKHPIHIALIVLAIGIAALSKAILDIYSTQHTVTNKRVISKRGLIATRISEVWISDIRGIKFSRNIWQAMIGTGNIVIGTAATGRAEIVITDVANAKALMDAINSLR